MSKYCPSCSETAPSYATLCRHCFYDFKKAEQPKRFPIGLSGGIFFLGLVALFITQHLASSQVANRYILDVETQALLIAQSTNKGTSVDRLPFNQIKRIEHIIGGSESKYEIVAVVKNGDDLILKGSDSSLDRDAQNMATLSGIPYEEVNNSNLSVD